MNNENGQALLARVRPGCLVTVRQPDGRQVTGRAHYLPMSDSWHTRTGRDAMPQAVTASNIIRVQEG